MGQFGKIGTSVSPAQIKRTKGSKNYIGRGVFLSDDYLCKAVAYDPIAKCMVDLDQTSAARYHLQPVLYYYFLLARFTNVTATGDPLSGDFVVEYARMTSGQYETFLGLTRNMPTFNGVVSIEYTEKMGDNGKDLSYTYFVPYMRPMDPSLLVGVQRLSSDAEAVKGLWGIVDSVTGMSVSQYEARLAELSSGSGRALPGSAPGGYVGVGSGAGVGAGGQGGYAGGIGAGAPYGGPGVMPQGSPVGGGYVGSGYPQPQGSPTGYGGYAGGQSVPGPVDGGGSVSTSAASQPGVAPTFGSPAPTFGQSAPGVGAPTPGSVPAGGQPTGTPAGGVTPGGVAPGGTMYVERGAPVMPNGPLSGMEGPVSGVQEFANFEDMGQGDLPF